MQKILVIQQKMIGDVLLSTIVCEALKTKYPNSEISYVVNTNTIAVVDEHPCIHRIIEFKTEYRTSKLAFFNFLNQLRKEKYDIVVDAYGKLESNLMTLFTGAKTKISYNKNYTKFIYNKNIERKAIVLTNAGNAVENRLRLVFNASQTIVLNNTSPIIFC